MPTVALEQGPLTYVDVGEGPTLVFVHGVLVDHQIWSGVIERLSSRFRCIAPTLPVGSHRTPMNPDADLSIRGQAAILRRFLEVLDLSSVTLVGNDTGGVVCQLVVADAPARVERLVLTDCDAFEVFPPRGFGYLLWAPRVPGLMPLCFAALRRWPRLLRLPVAYGALTWRRLDDALLASWVRPAATDPAIRRDLRKLLVGAGPHLTLEVADRLPSFGGRARLLWSKDDRFFPLSLGRRLLARFRDAELVELDGAGLLVPLDVPDQVARGIEGFFEAGDARA